MVKIAVMFTNYGPYHLARVDAFRKDCCRLGWNVVGIELARSEAEYPWETKRENLNFNVFSIISDQEIEKVSIFRLIKELFATLNRINPDICVIAGYARLAMLSTLLWSFLHRKPAILLSASKEDDSVRSWWQENFKSLLLKGYSAALVGGQSHKRYLVKLDMAADSIFFGYNVVDNAVFHPDKTKHLPKPINRPYFLAINRFVPKKNLLFLISSYTAYRQAARAYAWDLVLCGDGQLRQQIEQQINELGLKDVVHLPGFLQQDELLPYLARASCFIHASSQEQWGLVVNEAMAASLPVLVSNRCGCFEDLVIEGVSGFSFDPENSQQLTDLMLKVSSGDIDLAKIGNSAFEHIQKLSPDYFAQGLIQAVEYAIVNS